MDDTLHAERLLGRAKRPHRRDIGELPDGAFAAFAGEPRRKVRRLANNRLLLSCTCSDQIGDYD
jgi:hypothetical protein